MPARPELPSSKRSGRGPAPGGPSGGGAWLPWPMALALCRLDLRPPSHARVFLAVAFTSARYGGGEARLGIADLAEMTGLSPRTVKEAVSALVTRGLLTRVGRYKCLKVDAEAVEEAVRGADKLAPPGGEIADEGGADKIAPPVDEIAHEGGADKIAPRRCRQDCTSPTGIKVSSSREGYGEGALTPRQAALIAEVLAEATELLGSDAAELPLPDPVTLRLGFRHPVNYRQAIELVDRSRDRTRARDLTAAVLALRRDERVQGKDLPASPGPDGEATSGPSRVPDGKIGEAGVPPIPVVGGAGSIEGDRGRSHTDGVNPGHRQRDGCHTDTPSRRRT